MKNKTFLLILLVITAGSELWVRCFQNQPAPSANNITPIEITLDDKDGKVSLTSNFYFIFDGSGSMDDNCSGQRKIIGAKEAIRQFLEKVPNNVNLGLYSFNCKDEGEILALKPNNREAFLKYIDGVEPGGGTPLADAIVAGTNALVKKYKQQLGYGDYRLIVVTDGQASDIPGAARYAAKYGIPIYAIGLCIEGDHPLRTYAMSYRDASNYDDLKKALEETIAEIPSYDPNMFEGL
jgi:uncharacterized protein with von Willebrand factor type A (vWA) domain